MNYCTKCQSGYSEPGTCNCYAAAMPVQLPWTWCGACGQSHPMGQCSYGMYQPWRPLSENTCSTVATTVREMAEDVRNGRATFTYALSRIADSAADDAAAMSGTKF